MQLLLLAQNKTKLTITAGQATPLGRSCHANRAGHATRLKYVKPIFTLAGQAMLENRLKDDQDEERKNPSNLKAVEYQGDGPRHA